MEGLIISPETRVSMMNDVEKSLKNVKEQLLKTLEESPKDVCVLSDIFSDYLRLLVSIKMMNKAHKDLSEMERTEGKEKEAE